MIGWRVDPPLVGSPTRRWCSRSSRPARRTSRRGRYGSGSSTHVRAPARDHHEPEAQPPAQAPDLGLALRPRAHREVDRVGHRQPVDPLVDQRQGEGPLELHDDRRLVAADADDVAARDLALDLVALPLAAAP